MEFLISKVFREIVFKASTATGKCSDELIRTASFTVSLNLDPSAGELGAQGKERLKNEKALRIVSLR